MSKLLSSNHLENFTQNLVALSKSMEENRLSQTTSKAVSWRKAIRPENRLAIQGEPFIWLTAGALLISLCMIIGMLGLIFSKGFSTFWPKPLIQVSTADGQTLMGEVFRQESFAGAHDDDASPIQQRRLLRTGNFELTGSHFHWVEDREINAESQPAAAMLVERLSWGRFYGMPSGYVLEGIRYDHLDEAKITDFYKRFHAKVLDEIAQNPRSAAALAERYQIILQTADHQEKVLPLTEIVRAFFPNQLSFMAKTRVYLARWQEFLFADPREANSEGGVFPAIFGTVCMTLLMSIFVVPFGVLAALYLREYAREGLLVRAIRIAINNLAGVPSIVFGVFGLGFFCYIVGGSMDQIFFAKDLPNPTLGKGALIWASLTLALLTLPVVIVATEEALAAVPNSLRQGSYACGASQWQTIRKIVLPRALPGIMTGMILAIARGAGEVAPLMLVGAVKLAPKLPIDGESPFIHPERSFMHLGFHIYDLGFQSQNSEAALPMVFTTTLLLILIVLALNLLAITIRTRLRKAYTSAQF